MDLTEFSRLNRHRCESPEGFNQPIKEWTLSDWFTALAGEVGEAANVAKKLNRVRDGITGNSETPEQLKQMLADEIADAFIYLDLLAQSEGIDLSKAVPDKFHRTSMKIGFPTGNEPEPGQTTTGDLTFTESVAISQELQSIARVVDKRLQRATGGKPVPFSLFTWGGHRSQYVSNTDRDLAKSAMLETLARWVEDDGPLHKTAN